MADRYRVIGLLGRGGIGEVYRADVKLGQPVALKFLPPKLAQDPVRRERFFAKVRITRQLSHPNITRVYDIGDIDGRYFLSMEFIDGEDLASLIRRIGHLSNEKALDIARQLAAGLAAGLFLKGRASLNRLIPSESSPEALVERSHEILKQAGFTEKYEDSLHGFMNNTGLLRYLEKSDGNATLRKSLDPQATLFWYRQSPRSINLGPTFGSISPDNPPLQHAGEVLVILDAGGRLVLR